MSRYWLRKYNSGSPSRTTTSSTSAMKMVWSPTACVECNRHSRYARAPLQHGRALRGAIEAGARSFRVLMGLRRACVVFRDGLLIVAQHVHSESLAGVQMSVCPRPVINTNQNQHRVERDRGESVRRHAVDFAVLIDCDDRDPGCETPHGLAEIASGKAHTTPRAH